MIGTIVEVHDRPAPKDDQALSGDLVPGRLVVTLEGHGPVRENLSHAVSSTRSAIKRIGRVLLGRKDQGNGSPGRRVEQECELFIIGWEEPAARAILELPPPRPQLNLFDNLGRESLSCFLGGLRRISGRGVDPADLPHGFDQDVLGACLELSELLNTGFEAVSFRARVSEATLDRACRDRLRQHMITPPRLQCWTLVGRLEALSGRGRLTGVVWDEAGNRWICRFKSSHLDHLSQAWMRWVELTGRARLEPNRDRVLEVESIAVPGLSQDQAEPPDLGDAHPVFGEDDMADLCDLLTPEDDPEEMLKNILLD